MKNYREIRDKHPEMWECFFAFSKEQFNEGIKKNGLEYKTIFSGIGGLYGTKEGIRKFYLDYDKINEQIKTECDPQSVYDDEFSNHECDYICDDREAYEIVLHTFGKRKANTVKRRFANKN